MTTNAPIRASERGWFALTCLGLAVAVTCGVIVVLFGALDRNGNLDGARLAFGLVGLIGGGGVMVAGLLWATLRIMLSLDRHPS